MSAPIKQCKSCPWRVDCEPAKDIPGYREELHRKLTCTIRSGVESLVDGRHAMACHYSTPPTKVIHCAGWIANQLGVGNNIGVRLAVMRGTMSVPQVDGPQHERFEDTLPKKRRRSR